MVITSLLFSVRSLLVYWNLVNLVTNEQQKSGRTCINRVAAFNVFVKYVYNWLSFSLSQNNVEIKTRWGCHSTDMGLFRCLQMLLRFIDTYVDTLLLQCMGICFDSHLIYVLFFWAHMLIMGHLMGAVTVPGPLNVYTSMVGMTMKIKFLFGYMYMYYAILVCP